MSRNGKEIVCEGWLTKSPPTKRIWRGRWRRRWFSLHPGDLPGQFFLAYYTDRNCRKLKGLIDLDHCEQVDTGLKFEDKKFKFDFMFAIKTQPRTYYLAADTDNELKTWVKCICNICGLTATSDEEDVHLTVIEEQTEAKSNVYVVKQNTAGEDKQNSILESPPISPVSTSPYIPISECITGKSPVFLTPDLKDGLVRYTLQNTLDSEQYVHNQNHANLTYESFPTYLNFTPNDSESMRFYDSPRLLHPHKSTKSSKSTEDSSYRKVANSSPLQSPTDSESVFTDDDWTHSAGPPDQGFKHKRPSDSSTDMEIFMAQRLAKVSVDSNKLEGSSQAPPRPPKPTHINHGPSYFNLPAHSTLPKTNKENINVHMKSNSMSEDLTRQVISDDMYDFPRSHQVESELCRSSLTKRHCYNNAAPVMCSEGQVFKYDMSPKPGTSHSHVFRYEMEDLADVPASPSSQSSSTAVYSNLPSPLLTDTQLLLPPVVNRGLKPKRKLSDSLSVSSNPEPSSPRLAPSVDRKLKPTMLLPSAIYDVQYSNVKKENNEEPIRSKMRAAPSPTPPAVRHSHNSLFSEPEEIYLFSKQNYHKLEYLDLDLDNINSQFTKSKNSQPMRSPGANTVYKKVDFMKTEAFNITRNNLEEERKCKK